MTRAKTRGSFFGDSAPVTHVAKISILNKAYEISKVIKQITEITHIHDVIVVAHSMTSPTGCYDYPNNQPYYVNPQCSPGSADATFANDIGDLITVDTPHSGK